MTHPTKVLLVEDSPVALEILKRLLATSPEIKVVGTARNGKEALELIPQVQPNVICTDLHMKEMDGLEFTKQVMTKDARPILVISTSVQKEDTQTIFQLLEAGAVDVFPKPSAGLAANYEQVKRELIGKIKVLSGVKVFTKRQLQSTTTAKEVKSPQPLPIGQLVDVTAPFRVVTIGASTGGPQALNSLLSQLPSNFPVPVICTQHICEGFLQGLVDWLALECQLKVKISQNGELPLPGTIYFAPERCHLEIDAQGKFAYSIAPPVDGHRPSVTVTFKSVAKFYGRATAAILLTGMGRDGAEGMRMISQVGGMTIAQDEKSSVVFGMPKEAITLGAAKHILPVQEIAPLLLKTCVKKS